MSGLRERKKEATRELLQSTALQLFKKEGFYEVSMRDLAKACDLSLGTFYNYYQSKEEVLTSIIEEKIRRLYVEWEEAPSRKRESFGDFVETLFTLHMQVLKEFRQHIHVLLATLNLAESGRAQGELYRRQLWDFVLKNNKLEFPSLSANEHASYFFWGAYLNFLMIWSEDKSSGLKTTRAYLTSLAEYLTHAFRGALKT